MAGCGLYKVMHVLGHHRCLYKCDSLQDSKITLLLVTSSMEPKQIAMDLTPIQGSSAPASKPKLKSSDTSYSSKDAVYTSVSQDKRVESSCGAVERLERRGIEKPEEQYSAPIASAKRPRVDDTDAEKYTNARRRLRFCESVKSSPSTPALYVCLNSDELWIAGPPTYHDVQNELQDISPLSNFIVPERPCFPASSPQSKVATKTAKIKAASANIGKSRKISQRSDAIKYVASPKNKARLLISNGKFPNKDSGEGIEKVLGKIDHLLDEYLVFFRNSFALNGIAVESASTSVVSGSNSTIEELERLLEGIQVPTLGVVSQLLEEADAIIKWQVYDRHV